MVQHVKRIAGPKSWPIKRKESEWITAPGSGHSMLESISLNSVLKDMLKLAKTTRESRYIIFNKGIFINGNKARSERTGVGMFDIVQVPDLKKEYVMLFNTRGRLTLKELGDKETGIKLARVEDKTYLQGKKVQLNLMGGMNIIVDKDKYSVGDTLVMSLPDKKVKDSIKLEKGAQVYLLTGKSISKVAKVEEIDGPVLTCVRDDMSFKIHKEEVVTVGKDKPYITLE